VSDTSDAYWTDRRQTLCTWIKTYGPSAAELYEGAVRLLYGPPIPGRIRFVCHAVREIGNRLPDAVAGRQNKGRLDYTSYLDEIAKQWDARAVQEETALSNHDDGRLGAREPQLATVHVPLELVRILDDLVSEHRAARERPYEKAYRLYESCAPENELLRGAYRAIVDHWVNTIRWFTELAHDNGQPDSYTDIVRLRSQFERFEEFLVNLSGVVPFYDDLKEIDAILDATNN
jgi:hypothetical protein